MTEKRSLLLATAGIAVVLFLSGCAGSQSSAPAEAVAPSSSATPTVVALPVGFPSKVPLLEGPILHVSHPGNIWAAWVGSHDLVGDLSTATGLLVAAGFENTTGGPAYADFTGTDYEVRVVAMVDTDYGSSLAYTIVEKG